MRLCRFIKDEKLWGCLAAMSIAGRHLDTVEVGINTPDPIMHSDTLDVRYFSDCFRFGTLNVMIPFERLDNQEIL